MFVYCLLTCLFIYWVSRETEKKGKNIAHAAMNDAARTDWTFSNWTQQIVMQKMLLMLSEMQRLEQEFAVAVRPESSTSGYLCGD